MQVIAMRRAIMPVACIVVRGFGMVHRVYGEGKVLIIGGGMDRRQRLVEQYRQQSESTRKPVKAARAPSRNRLSA